MLDITATPGQTPKPLSPSRGIRIRDFSLAANEIIAKRRIVITTLVSSILLDVSITCIDVSFSNRLIAIAAGKVIYIWNLDSFTVMYKLGRSTGSIHKEDIKSCAFHPNGNRIVSCGADKKVVVWNIKQQKAEKILEGHKGEIYHVKFSLDGHFVYSSSEDGKVFVWDWMTGHIIHSFMRHPAAVRYFCTSPLVPHKIVCGRNDGHISAWDLDYRANFDTILPDPDWIDYGMDEVGREDKRKHHSGAINALEFSPNFHFLASGSADYTCKLWSIASYVKQYPFVQKEQEETKQAMQKLDGLIDVSEDDYLNQLKHKYYYALKGGEVPIYPGYHADLVFTFVHEGPVLDVKFNEDSEQIFGIQAMAKEEELPNYWQELEMELAFAEFEEENDAKKSESDVRSEIRTAALKAAAQMKANAEATKAANLRRHQHQQQQKVVMGADGKLTTVTVTKEMQEEMRRRMQIRQLRKLISLGLALPSLLNSLLKEYPDVDSNQVMENIKKYSIPQRKVLRTIANADFTVHDSLQAMSSKNTSKMDVLFGAMAKGEGLTKFMLQNGYRALDPINEEEDEIEIYQHRDFRFRAQHDIEQERHRMPHHPAMAFEHPLSHLVKNANMLDSRPTGLFVGDDMDEMAQGEFTEMMKYDRNGLPRGSVIHFIPSEQIKLIKDYQHNRKVKPIFMRQLLNGAPTTKTSFPNFTMDAEYGDVKAMTMQPTIPQQGVRFNEPLKKNRTIPRLGEKEMFEKLILGPEGLKKMAETSKKTPMKPTVFGEKQKTEGFSRALKESKSVAEAYSSSRTIFKPEKYIQTRALNVYFENAGRTSETKPQNLYLGKVLSQPMAMRQAGKDLREAMIVGNSVHVKEHHFQDQ